MKRKQMVKVSIVLVAVVLNSCSADFGITSNYERVNTDELTLKGEDGRYYQVTVDSEGELKARAIDN